MYISNELLPINVFTIRFFFNFNVIYFETESKESGWFIFKRLIREFTVARYIFVSNAVVISVWYVETTFVNTLLFTSYSRKYIPRWKLLSIAIKTTRKISENLLKPGKLRNTRTLRSFGKFFSKRSARKFLRYKRKMSFHINIYILQFCISAIR